MSRRMALIGLGVAIALLILALVFAILLSQRPKGAATLLKESGTVLVKKPKTENFSQVLGDETPLENGTSIKTEDGLAHVLFTNGSRMSVDKNTEVYIAVETGNIAIVQALGNTWHRVENLLGKEYKVETPTTVATVRGTEFAVEVPAEPEAPTTIYVTENTVDVGELVQAEGRKIALNMRPVSQGNMAHVGKVEAAVAEPQSIEPQPEPEKKQAMDVQQMPEEKQTTKWFERNKAIKKSFDRRKKPKEIIKTIREDKELHDIDQKPDEPRDLLGAQTNKLDIGSIGTYLSSTENDETLCKELTSTKQESLLKELTQAQKTNALPEELISKLKTLVLAATRACTDGTLSPEEFELLKPMVTGIQRDLTPTRR